MLDKSIPYYNIIMKRLRGTKYPKAILPNSYTFRAFEPGDEKVWAEIMVAVGEFDSLEEASEYFEANYLTDLEALKKRGLFIVDSHGHCVATLTNWWNDSGEIKEPSVHWVGVLPAHQGLGLGKAIVFEGMKRMIALEGDRDYYLHTQTWSYVAVSIYKKVGYQIVKDEVFGEYQNDYELAIETIKDKLGIA
jgi:ribosomal protein S18 acetylase RimI-like enzyme